MTHTIKFWRLISTALAIAVCLPDAAGQASTSVRTVIPLAHSMAITGMAHIDGTTSVASTGADGRVKIWDEGSGLLQAEFSSQDSRPVAGIASDSSRPGVVAIATLVTSHSPLDLEGGEANIELRNLKNGATVLKFKGFGGRPLFSPTGNWLTSAAHSLLYVWSAHTGRLHVALETDLAWAEFSGPDTLVYRRGERLVFLNLLTGASQAFPTASRGVFAVSGDGSLLADVGDRELRLWQVSDHTLLAKRPLLSTPDFISFAQDGSVVAGGFMNSIWAGSARNFVYRLKPADWSLESFTIGHSPISRISVIGDIAYVGERDGHIERFDLVERSRKSALGIDEDDITALAFSADGRYLAAGYSAGGAAVWEPTSNWYRVVDPLKRVRTPPSPVFADVNKQERYSATYTAGEGVTNAKEIGADRVIGMSFLGPEAMLMAHLSGKAEVVDISDGRVLKTFTASDPLGVISGSTARAAILQRHGVTFVDSKTLSTRFTPIEGALIRCAALSPVGDRLVVYGYQATVEIDAERGVETHRGAAISGAPEFLESGKLVTVSWAAPPIENPSSSTEEPPGAVAWSVPDELGALASAEGKVTTWRKSEHGYVSQEFYTGGAVYSAAISPDGRTLAFGSGHGNIAIFRASSGKRLADLMSLDQRGWLAHSPSGGFDGSYAAWDKVQGIAPNAPLVPIEIANLFNAYYHPQLLAEVMKADSGLDSAKAGLDVVQSRNPPQVAITSPRANYVREAAPPSSSTVQLQNDARRDNKGAPLSWDVISPNEEGSQVHGGRQVVDAVAEFKASIHDGGDGVKECRVFRNRRLLQSISPSLDVDGRAEIKATVPVTDGDNAFSSYCFSTSGLRSPESEVRVFGAASLAAKRHAYLLIVGIDTYTPSDSSLKYAVADAGLAKEKLESSLRATTQYDDVHTAVLVDHHATADNILSGLKILAGTQAAPNQGELSKLRRSAPSDTVFFYFAGHGGGFGGDYRLIASDGIMSSNATKGTVSSTEIRDALEPLQADRAVIILDACESGQALDQVDSRAGPLAGKSLAQLAYDKAMFVISASQSQQSALELQRLGHGVFSHVLFNLGFTGAADANADGFTTIGEWFAYAQSETPKEAQKAIDERQRNGGVAPATKAEGNKSRSYFADQSLNRAQTPRVFIPDPELAHEFVVVQPQKDQQ